MDIQLVWSGWIVGGGKRVIVPVIPSIESFNSDIAGQLAAVSIRSRDQMSVGILRRIVNVLQHRLCDGGVFIGKKSRLTIGVGKNAEQHLIGHINEVDCAVCRNRIDRPVVTCGDCTLVFFRIRQPRGSAARMEGIGGARRFRSDGPVPGQAEIPDMDVAVIAAVLCADSWLWESTAVTV